MINLNSSSSWFHSDELEEQDGSQTVIPRHELMNIVSVTQLEKDTILVAYDSEWLLSHTAGPNCIISDVVKVVNLQGKMKSSKRQQSELHFDFTISYIGEECIVLDTDHHLIVCLTFSLLNGLRAGLPQAGDAGPELQKQ